MNGTQHNILVTGSGSLGQHAHLIINLGATYALQLTLGCLVHDLLMTRLRPDDRHEQGAGLQALLFDHPQLLLKHVHC